MLAAPAHALPAIDGPCTWAHRSVQIGRLFTFVTSQSSSIIALPPPPHWLPLSCAPIAPSVPFLCYSSEASLLKCRSLSFEWL
ncbi:hypothetical protein K438DRAFT_198655 [Mycena galopus ATCC 62051]|nr:hypothetical protein K438DRAFT_198655 [Mycena galopus ATCC 62051]